MAEETRKMEIRLQELKLAMAHEKEEREWVTFRMKQICCSGQGSFVQTKNKSFLKTRCVLDFIFHRRQGSGGYWRAAQPSPTKMAKENKVTNKKTRNAW